MPKSGYFIIYYKNETDVTVYLDNLVLSHRSGPLLQESDTYAFGGSIDALESRSFGRAENKYGYNGKEKQPDLGLEWLDYGARMYDGQVGRWHVQDILSDLYENTSCYAYVGNNPIFRKDIYGMDWYRVNVDGHYEYHFDPNLTANNAKDVLQKGQEYFSASGTITTYSKNADGTNGKILSQFDLNSDGSVLNKLSNKKLDAGTSTITDFGSTINAINDLPGTEQFLNGETYNSCDGNSYQLSNNEWIKLSGIMVDPMVYRSIGWSGGYNPPLKLNQSTIVDNNVMVDALNKSLKNAEGGLIAGFILELGATKMISKPNSRLLVATILYNIYKGAFDQAATNLKHDQEAIRLRQNQNTKK